MGRARRSQSSVKEAYPSHCGHTPEASGEAHHLGTRSSRPESTSNSIPACQTSPCTTSYGISQRKCGGHFTGRVSSLFVLRACAMYGCVGHPPHGLQRAPSFARCFQEAQSSKTKKQMIAHCTPYADQKSMFHTSARRRLKDPEANSIPKEFVNLCNDAVEKNNKASYWMLDRYACRFYTYI